MQTSAQNSVCHPDEPLAAIKVLRRRGKRFAFRAEQNRDAKPKWDQVTSLDGISNECYFPFGCLAFQRPNKILHYSLDMGKMVLHFLIAALANVGRLLATSLRLVVSELPHRGEVCSLIHSHGCDIVLLILAPFSDTLRTGVAVLTHAEKERQKCFSVERDQRIEIGTTSVDRFVGGKQNQDSQTTNAKADKIE